MFQLINEWFPNVAFNARNLHPDTHQVIRIDQSTACSCVIVILCCWGIKCDLFLRQSDCNLLKESSDSRIKPKCHIIDYFAALLCILDPAFLFDTNSLCHTHKATS